MRLGLLIYQSLRELPAFAPILEGLRGYEAAGFGSVFVMEHHLRTFDDAFLNPLLFLAHIAASSDRLELGQSIMLPNFYHPVLLAEQAATLDHLSRGRAVMGFGVGWQRDEFDAFEIPYDTRVSRFEEGITLVRALWRGGTVSHRGDHFSLDGVEAGLTPYRRSAIPILLAGIAPGALRRAASLGDGWVASLWIEREKLENSIRQLAELRRQNEQDGDFRVVASRFIAVCDTDADAMALARRTLRGYLNRRNEWGHPILGLLEDSSAEGLRNRIIVGSPDSVADQVSGYARSGVTDLNLRFAMEGMSEQDVESSIGLFVDHVMPRLPVGRPVL